jgi:hypothetical protein
MFAYRLAWQMRELNVDAMLDRLSPEDLDRWQAAYYTGQLDDAWQQAAMICAELRNLPKRIWVQRFGGEINPKDLTKPREFLPQFEEPKESGQDSVAAYQRHLARKYGKK